MPTIAPRLAPSGYVVSLQNGLNEPDDRGGRGRERGSSAPSSTSAPTWSARADHRWATAATFRIGELDGRDSDRVRALAADIEDAEATDNVLGFLWAKEAYGAMLFATAVTDLSIADALAEPRYRPLSRARPRGARARPVTAEAFDGFDPVDLDGSIDRLVEFNRRSAKTHSGIYRDLAVRHRPTEVDAMLRRSRGRWCAAPRSWSTRSRTAAVTAGAQPRPARGLRAARARGRGR